MAQHAEQDQAVAPAEVVVGEVVAQPVGGLGPEGLVGGVPAQLLDQGQLRVGAQVDAGQLGRPVEDLGVARPDLLQVGD